MKFLLENSPHDRSDKNKTSVIMFMIIAGMIPAVIMHIYCFGLGLIWHLLISCLGAYCNRNYICHGNCQTVFRRARPEHLQSGHGSLYSTADFSTDCHEQLEYP